MDRKLSSDELNQDIDFLIKQYRGYHPDLESRITSDELSKQYESLSSQLSKSMTRREFFIVIGKLTEHLKDGHSGVIYPYPEFDRYYEGGGRIFPLSVRLDDELNGYIDKPYENIPVGAQLLTVNGQRFSELIEDLSSYARGESLALRAEVVSKELGKWLWHIYDIGEEVEVTYSVNSTERRSLIKGISLTERESGDAKLDQKDLMLTTLNETSALMTINYFGMDKGEFEEFVDSSFEQIEQEQVEHLLIDLRKNPGGSTDNVEYLLGYLAADDCDIVSDVKERPFNRPLEALNTNVTVSPHGSDADFRGTVSVLIGNYTYSAAIVMATAIQDCNVGTLVGQRTGGFANQTGQIRFFNLPNSQLRAFVPTRLLVRPSGQMDTVPVIPDVEVPAHTDTSADPVIDVALSLTDAR
ncbi:hypothetical protein KUV89_03270 [Marinobacter hydrocarbonoclasticus]|nr:hypothetical protein [Marinobacter nauticus]